MSDSDSFIEEVTEEVRRDRLYGYLKRYGWIAALIILGIVGGAAWSEWQKAQTEAAAQALGDEILSALDSPEPQARIDALGEIDAGSPGGSAMLQLLIAAEQAQDGQTEAATGALAGVASNGELPQIYRQIAAFKALLAQGTETPAAERRIGFENLAVPGNTLRALAEEQLALIDVEEGDTDGAITRLTRLIDDAEATEGLRQRARQLIVALGGEPSETDAT
ncbi:tetratricopeptide repeat protein [Pseudaestuariivita sp.]|uniref:tetratricopeptide repeat protein n=1 Tax=Pseudaestuariivita sp. TaxID=2211669 RepID=UPI004059DD09